MKFWKGEGYAEAEHRIALATWERAVALNLSGLHLTQLPDSLWKLTALAELHLSSNRLRALPNALGQLTELKRLDLSNNELTSLPETLTRLTKLDWLDVSNNWITTFPPALGKLTCLERLNACNNGLTRLPEGLEHLTQLRVLDLSHNQLTDLPEGLHELAVKGELQGLFLSRNPALNLPEEILRSPRRVARWMAPPLPKDILGYYFAHRATAQATGTAPLMEAKVLVLGEASVGKSCLIAALSENKTRDELDGKGTSGIVRKLWEVPVKGDWLVPKDPDPGAEKLRLNLWDFGGQEIYHSAHTLFLTRRAIYLIVVSKRDNDRQNNLDYWLRMAASFGGPDAVTYVVVNKCDEKVGHPPDEQALRRKYPQLRGFLYTSCDDLDGIPEAREVIVREALQLEGVRLPVAKTWLETKKAVETMRDHTLSMEDWAKLCEGKKVLTPEAQRELLHLCDRLGTVRYFPTKENDPPELCNTAILNPDWVAVGIYALFDDEALNKRGGLLSPFEMQRILDKRGYPGTQARIIEEVMRRFFLLYDSAEHGEDHQMLVPLMLSEREPEFAWPAEGTLEFVYQYEVVPAGLVPAFMARRHRDLSKTVPPWRHGCVLEMKDCRARVIGDAETKQVLVSVTGAEPMRRDVLDKVRGTFEELHAAVQNLPVTQLIPVPGHPTAPLLDYDFVRDLEWQGEREFRTKGAHRGETIVVNVREALDGVRGETRRRKEMAQQQAAERASKFIVVERGAKYVENEDMSENYSNTGDNKGIIGKQNTQKISQSFNTEGADIPGLLRAWQTLREEAAKLSPAETEKVSPHLAVIEAGAKTLEAESKKANPNQSILDLTRDGMVTAAKTCAAMAPSLMKAANAVAEWFAESRA